MATVNTITLSDKSKVTDAQIIKGDKWLSSNGYLLKANNGSAYGLMLAHSIKAVVHSDAQLIAQRFLALKGIGTPFSASSCWHSSPKATARVYTGSLKRYSADSEKILFGAFVIACTEHKRSKLQCTNLCTQAVYSTVENKFAYDLNAPATTTPKKHKAKTQKPAATVAFVIEKTEAEANETQANTDARKAYTQGE